MKTIYQYFRIEKVHVLSCYISFRFSLYRDIQYRVNSLFPSNNIFLNNVTVELHIFLNVIYAAFCIL